MFRTTPFRHSHLNHQSRSVRIHIARFTLFSRLGHHSARHVFTRLRSHIFFSFFQGSHGPLHVRFTFFSRLPWPVSILYKALMARFTFFQGSHGPYHRFFFRRFTAPAHPHDSTPSHTGKPTRATQCILRILFKLLIIKPPTAAVSGCHRLLLPEVRHVASQRFWCGWVGFEISTAKYQARPNWGDRPLKEKSRNRDHKNLGPQGRLLFLIKPKINFVYTKP